MSENENGSATLYAKLARIMGQINRMQKTGVNKEQGYKFVQDADVLDTIRTMLADANIAFLANMVGREQTIAGQTQRGTDIRHTIADFEFTFACGDTGATVTSTWSGESLEWSDKGISKAATSAEKFFLLKTFLISTGNDPDTRTIEPVRAQPQQQRKVDKSTGEITEAPAQPATVSHIDEGTRELACAVVELKEYTDRKSKETKLRVVYNCADGVYASSFTREHARRAGYVVDTWTKAGRYELPVTALVTVKKNGDFWDVVSVRSSMPDTLAPTGTDTPF